MPDDFQTTADRAFHSVFFSVSGFCNAGFVTTSDSMESLRGHFLPHLILAPMIVLGSIGFPVLDNLWRVFKAKLRGQHVEGGRGVVGGTSESGRLIRLELNTKIILATTAFAYVLGYVLIFLGEMFQTNEPLRLIALDAHFMNINRTSGFNTIPPDEMGLLSRLVLIFLMFLGGSPASLAGGIKLMVFAVLALTVFATIRGRRETTAFGRTIPDAVVRKSAALIVLCLTIVLAVTGVLAVSERGGMGEDGPALDVLLFEATSAFGTTGLSLGITDELSPVGRWTIIVAMFLGRVGILAAVAALVSVAAVRRPRTAYPSGEVVVY
jgi:trk system potassium uptake protein TrkH